MMGRRERLIDPTTRDYVSDGAGGYETITDARTAVYHAIIGERGRWWGDPQAGSRLWELERARSIERVTAEELRDRLAEALQPLVDASRIANVEIITERDGQRGLFELKMDDTATGQQITLVDLLSVGA